MSWLSRQKMIVGYVQVYSTLDRLTSAVVDGEWIDPRENHVLPIPVNGSYSEVQARYWCAADAPQPFEGDDFKLAPVYRTSKLADPDACCDTCGASIRGLQQQLTDTFERIKSDKDRGDA